MSGPERTEAHLLAAAQQDGTWGMVRCSCGWNLGGNTFGGAKQVAGRLRAAFEAHRARESKPA